MKNMHTRCQFGRRQGGLIYPKVYFRFILWTRSWKHLMVATIDGARYVEGPTTFESRKMQVQK